MRLAPYGVLALVLAGCSDSTLKATNADPEASIVSHADGDTVPEGVVTAFRGRAGDPDDAKSSLLTAWYANGVSLCEAAAPGDDGTTPCEGALPAGTVELSLEVVDPSGAAATDSVTLEVSPTGAPTVDITAPVETGSYRSDALVAFTANVDDAEDAPETLSFGLTSSRDGDLSGQVTGDSAGVAAAYLSLSEGEHALTLTATDTTGKVGRDTVVIDVGPPNAVPDCGITSPADDTVVALGDAVQLDGYARDATDPASALIVSWSSDRDGLLASLTPDSSGRVPFNTSALSAATHALTLRVEDPLGEVCAQTVLLTVGAPPVIELLAPVPGEVVADGDAVAFSATVSDAEDGPASLSLAWESSLDGLFSVQGADGTGVAAFDMEGLAVGEHLVTVTVTDRSGLSASASTRVVVDGLPTAPGVTLSPSAPHTVDPLVASIAVPSTDVDGDPLSYRVAWYRDGALSAASTTLTLPASATTRGELWEVVVTPNDGTFDGAPGSASVTILNTAPSLAGAAISPSTPYAGDALTCAGAVYTDADGDADASTMNWTVNGTPAGAGSALSRAVVRGDVVTCTVTPFDGTDAGTPVSTSVTVGNRAPTLTSVSLSPALPRTNDTLSVSGVSADSDGDTVIVSWAWTVNGVSAGTGTSLSGTAFSKGDTVAVTGTPNDGTTSGTPVSVSTTILNTAPSAPVVALEPTEPGAGIDDLVCSVATASTDADLESLSYAVTWTKNGASWTGATLTTSVPGDTIDGALTTEADVWACSVRAWDGAAFSSAATASVTILASGYCRDAGYDGTFGATWQRLSSAPESLYSLMTWQGDDTPYIWNSYGARMSYYNPLTNAWTTVSASTPYSSPWNSAAPYGGSLWMIRNGSVYQYSLTTGAWTTRASYSGADDYNQTVSDCDGNIYGHAANGSIVVYNTTTGVVNQYYHGYTASQYETRLAYDPATHAVYFGAFNYANLYKFDIASRSFSVKASIPESQLNDIFCSDHSGHVYAAGGSGGTSIWKYTVATNSWATITSWTTDHGNNGSCTVSTDGYLYMSEGGSATFFRLPLY